MTDETKLELLLKKQQELEDKMAYLEKEVNVHTIDISELKEDRYKQLEEVKAMFVELTKEIKDLNNRLVATETINKVQEEKINGNLSFLTGQNSTMFKFIIYLTGLSLSGLFGFKILEFIQSIL